MIILTQDRARSGAGLVWAALIVLFLGTGCASDRPKSPRSSSMASVSLEGPSTTEIRLTAMQVFHENLFELSSSSPQDMVFEKPGSRMTDLAYRGFYEGPLWIRAKLAITRYGANAHLLHCDAFIVRDRGDAIFEDEQKLFKISKGPYKKMLKEIAARLEKPAL